MANLTPKQEAFVQAYLTNGGNQRAAYRTAYNAENMSDAVVDVKACELMKTGKVSVRVREIQERAAKRTEVTIETITGMLGRAYKQAVENGQAGAAVAASMGMAKLHGLIIEKKEDVTKRRAAREVEARIAGLLNIRAEDGASGPSGRAEAGSGPRETVPTVPGHGTA